MIKIIYESKQDIQNFRDKYGDELTNEFLSRRKQLKPPYNDIYFWLKDNPLNWDEETIEYYEGDYDDVDVGALESYLYSPASLSNAKQRSIAKSNSKMVYKDDTWTVISPTSYEAAIYYGKNTKWCISGNYENAGWGMAEDHFDRYDGYLIYIDKKHNKKYCFAERWYDNDGLTLWNETDDVLYEKGKWLKDNKSVCDEIMQIPDMPRIEFEERIYPYIETDSESGVRTFYNEYDEEQFCV